MKKKRELTLKQKQFCHEYLVDFNGAQAAIRAGYSKRSARSIAQENLTKPDVQEYLRGLTEKSLNRNKVSIDQVIGELKELAFSSMSDIVKADEKLEIVKLGKTVQDIGLRNDKIVRVKLYDKTKALALLLNYYHLSKTGNGNGSSQVILNFS